MADDLLVADFDRDPPGPPVPPPWPYLVCSTPRSGSTLLCEGLRATGRLATPAEYFNIEATLVPLSRRWGSADARAYVRDLYRHRTSPDGVLGVKLHWQQVEELRDVLGLAGERRGVFPRRERRLLEGLFPAARYVHVQRRDRDRQAVSYWIAEHTRQWSVHGGEEPPSACLPDYDAVAIDAVRRRIDHQEACWARFFAENGIAPVTVVYEELAADYAGTIARVARALDVDLRPADVPPPRLRRQSDDASERLLRRYLAERAVSV